MVIKKFLINHKIRYGVLDHSVAVLGLSLNLIGGVLISVPVYGKRFRFDKTGASVGWVDKEGGRGNPKKEEWARRFTTLGISLLYLGFVFQILDIYRN